MLFITEKYHRMPDKVWSCATREDYCLKLMQTYPNADWENDWGFDQFKAWHAQDLRQLIIESDE